MCVFSPRWVFRVGNAQPSGGPRETRTEACALSCPAGTVFRNYFVNGTGQSGGSNPGGMNGGWLGCALFFLSRRPSSVLELLSRFHPFSTPFGLVGPPRTGFPFLDQRPKDAWLPLGLPSSTNQKHLASLRSTRLSLSKRTFDVLTILASNLLSEDVPFAGQPGLILTSVGFAFCFRAHVQSRPTWHPCPFCRSKVLPAPYRSSGRQLDGLADVGELVGNAKEHLVQG